MIGDVNWAILIAIGLVIGGALIKMGEAMSAARQEKNSDGREQQD